MSVTSATLSACLLLGRRGRAATDDGKTEDRDERDCGSSHPFPY